MPITDATIADALGCSVRLVTRYKGQGMPTKSVAAARAWKAENVRQRVKPNGAGPGEGAPEPSPSPDSYAEARRRLAVAEAQQAELNVLKDRAVLVHRDKVREEVGRRLAGLKEALLQLPARLQSVLAAEADEAKVHDVLQDEIYQALASVSDMVQ